MILPLLEKHIPSHSVSYCYSLWNNFKFNFQVTKKRATKLGDYRYYIAEESHTITVNGDLNKFTFLVTFLHEVAHLNVQLQYGNNIKPHGEEWKNEFKKLLVPVMNEETFPSGILQALKVYLVNPKASSCSDINLLKALSEHDAKKDLMFLSEIGKGATFCFNKKYFIKESIKRTRAICKEVKTGRRFYIPEAAQVELLQMSLF
ncbi:MAG: SprT-like domain-containing protein [Cytophagaceae bacterium]|nr:SprT-like domain-containing protein [Cytophagaceae bacterium]